MRKGRGFSSLWEDQLFVCDSFHLVPVLMLSQAKHILDLAEHCKHRITGRILTVFIFKYK